MRPSGGVSGHADSGLESGSVCRVPAHVIVRRPLRSEPPGSDCCGDCPCDEPPFHPRQHPAAAGAAGAGDQPASGRRVAADLAEDRGGAGRDERAAALVGLRLGRRAGTGALRARQSRRGRRAGPCSISAPARAWAPSPRQGWRRCGARRRHRPLCAGGHRRSTPKPTAWRSHHRRRPAGGAARRLGVVLVGDMFYERPLAERALAFIDAARAAGADVLVGDPRRSYFPKDRFRQIAEYSVPVTRDLEDMEIKRTAVWRLADHRTWLPMQTQLGRTPVEEMHHRQSQLLADPGRRHCQLRLRRRLVRRASRAMDGGGRHLGCDMEKRKAAMGPIRCPMSSPSSPC